MHILSCGVLSQFNFQLSTIFIPRIKSSDESILVSSARKPRTMLLRPKINLSMPIFKHQSLLRHSAVSSSAIKFKHRFVLLNGHRSAGRLAMTASFSSLSAEKRRGFAVRIVVTAVTQSRLCGVIDRSYSSTNIRSLQLNENKTSRSQSNITSTRLPKDPGSTWVIRCAMNPLVPGARPT